MLFEFSAPLKKALSDEPILKLADDRKPYVLRTDASNTGVGAVLMQEHNGQLFPVSYASRKLLDRERKYSTMERECLGIIFGLRKFEMYLYGKEFVLQTDHEPLGYLDRAKYLNDRIMRWSLYMQRFVFTVTVIKGSQNAGADFLSRVGCSS